MSVGNPEFVAEAQEIVEALNRDLIAVEQELRDGADEVDPDRINTLFRSAHSLKGISGMFGLEEMQTLAHEMENVLDGVRLGKITMDDSTLDVLYACVERFTVLTDEAAQGISSDGSGSAALIEQLKEVAEGPKEAGTDDPLEEFDLGQDVLGVLTEYEEHRLRENVKKGKNLYMLVSVFELATFDTGLAAVDDAVKGKGEVISKLPSSKETDEGCLAFDILVGSNLSKDELQAQVDSNSVTVEVIERAAAPAAPPPPPPPPTPAPTPAAPAKAAEAKSADKAGDKPEPPKAPQASRAVTQTVRVDIRRLDNLMNLVGELALTKMAVKEISESLKQELGFTGMAVDLHKESRNFDRRLAELQAGIMEVRMVPLENLFERMVRVGRQIGRELKKKVRIVVSGAHTELDKLIVEDLSEPLMHIIRNALDHGLEGPDERSASGKSEEGTIELSAVAQGNHVVVSIQDDGRGINRERVLKRGVERELVTPERAKELGDKDIFNLLFAPGFSTAEAVTEYSGRGVGMDVVKTKISDLSGIIDVESTEGEGTLFTVTLPMTLAIIPALIVSIAERTYALPLNNVLETIALADVRIKTIERREVISVRGATVPLVDLRDLFGLEGERASDSFGVVAGIGEHRIALIVDELIGQQDIVIKSLGRRLSNIPGIAGATELGNQQTILVIDMVGLINEVTSSDDIERPSASR